MSVIIREEQEVNGKLMTFKTFKPGGVLTGDDRRKAERIDQEISSNMKKIEDEIEKMGLFSLKGKGGVVKLWYEIGKRLSFIDKLDLNSDERRYIWRALYDHSKKLAPGPVGKRASDKDRMENSHFSYCYKLGKLPEETVLSADWTAWSEFFDRAISMDERILQWLSSKSSKKAGARQDWLRALTKEVGYEFANVDTKNSWKDKELHAKLNEIYKKLGYG